MKYLSFKEYRTNKRKEIQQHNRLECINGNNDESIKYQAGELWDDDYNLQLKYSKEDFIDYILNECHNGNDTMITFFRKDERKQAFDENTQIFLYKRFLFTCIQ